MCECVHERGPSCCAVRREGLSQQNRALWPMSLLCLGERISLGNRAPDELETSLTHSYPHNAMHVHILVSSRHTPNEEMDERKPRRDRQTASIRCRVGRGFLPPRLLISSLGNLIRSQRLHMQLAATATFVAVPLGVYGQALN